MGRFGDVRRAHGVDSSGKARFAGAVLWLASLDLPVRSYVGAVADSWSRSWCVCAASFGGVKALGEDRVGNMGHDLMVILVDGTV